MNIFWVTASKLNFRSSPEKADNLIIPDGLPNGKAVKKEAEAGGQWWQVSTEINGDFKTGYVSRNFLRAIPQRRIDAARWFKQQFGSKIESVFQGTPFDLNLAIAIALQETYYIWGTIYKTQPLTEVFKVCVGDTLDAPDRSAFPKNRKALEDSPQGKEMFKVARQALESVAKYNRAFKRVFDSNPNKFCRGYGIFQLDLQFFKEDPDYFLDKKWYDFDNCLNKFFEELNAATKRAYGIVKPSLTDEEKIYVAIAYNRGSVNFSRGFKQGYKDSDGKYYGEYVWEYFQMAKYIKIANSQETIDFAEREMHATRDGINFRSSPNFGDNIIGKLILAQPVIITGNQESDRWLPAKASIEGTTKTGFVSKNVLRDQLSMPRESLINLCVEEWIRFNRGKGQEHKPPFAGYVGEMWQSLGIQNRDGTDRNVFWSAAFISFVVRKAGGYDGFSYSIRHSQYVNQAIQKRLNNQDHPFWGFRISEHKVQPGDMVCSWRERKIDFDFASSNNKYPSHCDIVIAVEKDFVFTLGGNVSHSVSGTKYKIDNRGFLTGEGRVYGVLSNQR